MDREKDQFSRQETQPSCRDLPFHVDSGDFPATAPPRPEQKLTFATSPPPYTTPLPRTLTPQALEDTETSPTPSSSTSRSFRRLREAAEAAKRCGEVQAPGPVTTPLTPLLAAPVSQQATTPLPVSRHPAAPLSPPEEIQTSPYSHVKLSELMKTIDTEEIQSPHSTSESVSGFVLIVEDNVVNSRILQLHLEKNGLDTHVARDGQEALHVASELRPDLIILDVMLPSMNGFEICERIRHINDIDDVPIIFLTSQEREEEMLRAYDLGADDYITKSQLKPAVLAAKIKKLLRRRQRQLFQNIDALKSGMLIDGRYEILREIGRGGMGMVYLVRHKRLGFTLALKAMNLQRPNREKSMERFRREIQSLAEIHHPHVVRIHDCGEFGQIPYYVMEHIPGGSLFEKLQAQGGLPPHEALSIAGKLTAGLQCAHESRILHRDLKTENILFRRDRTPVLTDFGLVLNFAGDEEKRLTKVGCVVGTPHYMSPEQITQPNDIDGRSDVFSLGIVLYEMLTGQNPLIHFNRTEVMVKIVTEDIPSPLTVNPHLPQLAVDVCMRALRRKRNERFPSALAMSLACAQSARQLLGV